MEAIKNDMFHRAGMILDEMQAVELATADMYRRFAASFATDRIFWQDLAEEEEGHAAMVCVLKAALLRNGAPFEITSLNSAVLSTFRQGIEMQSMRLQRGEIGRRTALFIARDLERTLIERSFFDAIRSEKPDYCLVQEQIRRETEGHLEKLQNYILTIFP